MTKKLGFGLMRLPLLDPNDKSSIDLEQTKKMVDLFLERGFTYFDTAWMYCGYQSEVAIKEALVKRYPRDSYTLATKLHASYFNTIEQRDEIFHKQLEKTGVTYFDYYLLHDMGLGHYEKFKKFDCFNWIQSLKKKGLAKHIGFSFHDNAKVLDQILSEHPEFEFVQLQLNYIDWDNEGIQSRKCYEVCKKYNKDVFVMEPVKGGTLANVPKEVEKIMKDYSPNASIPSWAIRFAASLEQVKIVLSGMSNMEQCLDNTNYMQNFIPLNQQEQEIIKKSVELIHSSIEIPCTGCSYCLDGCPKQIPIPTYFSLYNAEKQESKTKGHTSQKEYYERLNMVYSKASECLKCHKCEKICPQHLPIVDSLKQVAKQFEKKK